MAKRSLVLRKIQHSDKASSSYAQPPRTHLIVSSLMGVAAMALVVAVEVVVAVVVLVVVTVVVELLGVLVFLLVVHVLEALRGWGTGI